MIKNPPVALIPKYPRDENYHGIKASPVNFGDELPGRGPPIGEAENVAAWGKLLPVQTK